MFENVKFGRLVFLVSSTMFLSACGKKDNPMVVPVNSGKMVLVPSGAGPTFKAYAPTTDPTEIAKRMVKAYQTPNSMQIRVSTDSKTDLMATRRSHQEVLTSFRRSPGMPKMKRLLVDMLTGTHTFFCDGINLVTYTNVTNSFLRRALTGNLDVLAAGMAEDAPLILEASNFLGAELPPGMEGFKYIGKQTISGKEALIVDARFTSAYLKELGQRERQAKTITPVSGTVRMWIDSNTYFLLKSEYALQIEARRANNEILKIVESFSQTTKEISVNPSLKDDFFEFRAPPRSIEVFNRIPKPSPDDPGSSTSSQ